MHFWTSEKKPVLPPVFMLSQTQLVLIFFTVYYTELYDHLPIGCTVLTWLSFSDGNYSTTPFGAQSAAAVTRPAVPAPKDGPTGVTLFCQMRRFVRGFFFLQVSLILFFFPCQDPTALVTNLFWDPWSSWIRLTRRPTTYHRCLALRCIDELFISRSLQSPDMCLKVLNIFLAGKPGVTWWRLCDCAQQRPVQDGLRLLAY